jgi:ribose/xylose/arabinose/galactoside ABC-type transport system permease subunit
VCCNDRARRSRAYLQSGVTVIGVGIRTVIQNVINQIGTLDSNYQSVVSGAFLLVVVVLQRSLARTAARR